MILQFANDIARNSQFDCVRLHRVLHFNRKQKHAIETKNASHCIALFLATLGNCFFNTARNASNHHNTQRLFFVLPLAFSHHFKPSCVCLAAITGINYFGIAQPLSFCTSCGSTPLALTNEFRV